MKKIIYLITVLILVLSLASGCSNDSNVSSEGDEIEFKMGTSTSDTSTWTIAAQKFADLVSEKSNGEIKITVYPSEQLSGGNQAKGVEMLRDGSIDFTFHSNLVYSVMDSKFNVVSLPFIMESVEDADEKLAGEGGNVLNEILLDNNIIGLGFGENGFRQITNSKREVKELNDMSNLKFRINNSQMLISTYKALGADPTSMNFSEVFTSLQQGAIDGQENPLDVIDSSKLYEVQKYISLWDCTYDIIILGMNKDKFNSLTQENQEIIRDCATEACNYQKKINREKGNDQIQKFKDEGLVITEKDKLDLNDFIQAVQPVYTEYEEIIGKDIIKLFR